ncbi:uncharacterized protein I303_102119 [Kwoniella dejecticola CBS 10117]|uniref:AAA+ ATPase domain-containing protein n=1 Tax=Kwoniella dejecticola CBS 10117 TaxID=1296121 RepID=A0A1A6ABU0_9TREE|nr:uncharacterized protein I303_01740 [Kwoniella dejecticola CBS 10117]OBR87532.1 hypothetical protein I303_01740 [Kwoniella dejecticola CBS 10117]
MAGATKRSRQDDNDTPNPNTSSSSSSSSTTSVEDASTPTPTATPTPTPPVTRNSSVHPRRPATTPSSSSITSTNANGNTNTASTSTSTSTSSTARPPLTRSSATQLSTPRHGALGRSNSLYNISTRRSGFTSSNSTSSSSTASSSTATFAVPSGSGSGSRVGMLTRTQSTPHMTSPASLKNAAISGGGAGGSGGKGGPEDNGIGGPSRRFGKGKENIPPKKDEEIDAENAAQEGSSRKRPRVSSRSSMSGRSGRTRSGSVVSVRSETSGRHSSLAPSSSASSICSWSARLPSPAPSQVSLAPSLDSITSVDPLDLIHDEEVFDVDKTPTKARPVTRSTVFPPTPPPSSPSLREVEIKSTAERVGLMRVQSDETETETETDMDSSESGPEKEKKLNPYKQLKAFLRLSSSTSSSVDQAIIGRDEEKKILRSYLADRNDVDVGMYISGPPGTGKTALVTALGRELGEEGWRVVELGCMGLKVTDIWRRLGEEMGCGKTEKDVKEFITRNDAKVFIILDEVDSLMPPPPSIAPPATSHLLTKLFSLPLLSPTIKLISISNTLDLTLRARLVLPDSAQPSILPFKAYGSVEMAPIVSARVNNANVEGIKLDPTAITLLSKKVEAQNGDLRMCLGVLSSAVSLAEAEWIRKTGANTEPEKTIPMTKISIPHIVKAVTSYAQQLKAAAGSSSGAGNATHKKIRSVQIQGKMVLVSILIHLSRVKVGLNGCPSISSSSSSVSANGQLTPPLTPSRSNSSGLGLGLGQGQEMNIGNLYATYSYILLHNSSPFPPSTESDYRDLLSNLETLGLVNVAGASSGGGMTRSSSMSNGLKSKSPGGGKIELIIREDELKEGLGLLEGQTKGSAEEEVKRIWEREESRIRRIKEKSKAAILADGTNDHQLF